MTTTTRIIAACIACLAIIGVALEATPTSLFWTPCTTDVQREMTVELGLYDYFKPGSPRHHQFPTDLYATYGLFSWENINCEFGVDYDVQPSNLWYFNAKLGIDEDKMWDWSPGFSVGVFNVGTKSRKTNEDVWDAVIGHSVPGIGGNLYFGGYIGRKKALHHQRGGWMVGYKRGFFTRQSSDGRSYDPWLIVADYMSGKNVLGGGGVAIGYNFTPDINILTGPVWFRDTKANGNWKWSVQVNATVF